MAYKENKIILLDILYWGIIVIMALSTTITEVADEIRIGSLDSINIEIVFSIISLFIFSVLISMFLLFFITVPYIGIKIAYIMHTRRRLDKIDFKNDKYYRDILPKYSAGVLGYIDGFSLTEKDIVATLLTLELKGKIKIQDKINIINDSDEELSINEKYIFNHLKAGTLKNINILEFESQVRKDCINSNLLETKKSSKRKKVKEVIISILVYLLIILLFKGLQVVNFEVQLIDTLFVMVSVLVFLALIVYPLAVIVSIISSKVMKSINPYVRTKLGKEVNTKLEGLKKYISDFSNLDERGKEAVEIWEYYLVYSVMFGINTKAVEQVMDKI